MENNLDEEASMKKNEKFYIAYGPELNQEFMPRLCPAARYVCKFELKADIKLKEKQ